MTHTIRLFAVVAILAAAGFAPAPFPKKERAQRDDMAAMLGLWEFTAWERNGNNEASSAKQYLIEIKQGKYIFVAAPASPSSTRTIYELILHRNQYPRSFEWKMGGRVSYIGSYRLEGEVLTMIFKSGSNLADRPIDFNGRHEFRFVMRRIKR